MEKTTIWGNILDTAGRCVHWHSDRDVIANRCATCGKFYACYECHQAYESHPFGRYAAQTQQKIVLCGVCGLQMTYAHYEAIDQCESCGALFNPGAPCISICTCNRKTVDIMLTSTVFLITNVIGKLVISKNLPCHW